MSSTIKNLLSHFILLVLLLNVKSSFAQVEFIQNKGQWEKNINYRGDFYGGAFFLQNTGFTVSMQNAADMARLSGDIHGGLNKSPKGAGDDTVTVHSFSYTVSFLGASQNVSNIPDKPVRTYNNYFIGNDPSKWAHDCKLYNAVTYKDVYPNIDVRYYSTSDRLKYDFIVHPGGNPDAIAMRFDGPLSLNIKNKELVIGTTLGDTKELTPYSYEGGTTGTSDVDAKYIIRDNVVTFNIGKYDPQSTLVIDPQLIFSTLTGSTPDNWGYTATPGPDGSFFAGGIAFGQGFPVSPGAYQTTYHGGVSEGNTTNPYDIAIIKFSPDGGQRLYGTYIGGGGNEQPHSLIADRDGNLVMAGRSNSGGGSNGYPTKGGGPNSGAGYDIVITKFNAAGTDIIGSVRIGGGTDDGVNIKPKNIDEGPLSLRKNYGDDARSEVILDAANNVYLASSSQSNDFPVTAGVFQPTKSAGQDGVILKLNPNLSTVLFSTFFGGGGDDACFVAAISPTNGNLYIGGSTGSGSFPISTPGAMNTTSRGNIDGFVTEINTTGTAIIKTTFIGTSADDMLYGLKFDRKGFPYIMGTTYGSWNVVNAPYSNPGSKQFIAKLQPDLSAFVYSTVFGKSAAEPSISPIAFLVDRCENVYVSGWGGGINEGEGYSHSNTTGLPEVNPLNVRPPDGADFYFFVLRKDAANQLFGSHFGQYGGFGDHVDGGTSRFDENGVIYQAICANCGGRNAPQVFFPTTPGAYASLNGSSICNEAAVKIEMNFSGVGAEIQSSIAGQIADSTGCAPLSVHFKDLLKKGVTYYWNFNSAVNPNAVDLTTSTPEADFTFLNPGFYRVRLIAEDLNTCNQRDTSYITIKAGNNPATPRFTKKKREPCTSTTYDFTNTSIPGGSSTFGPQSFVWDFGDGAPRETHGAETVSHTYPGPGTYFVKLFIIDTTFCNSPDSIIDTLRLNSQVKAIPSTPALGCAPYAAHFTNNSLGGLSFLWDFGDPASGALNTSTDFEPTHIYQNIGTYFYTLTAYDSTTCNKVDVTGPIKITVVQKPQASGDWAPNPPQANVPVRFTNLSHFADHYLWDFGDSETSADAAPVHEYNVTGSYNAKLIAYNLAGCTDTFPLVVNVIINPLLDVPNAFTPGRFGINSYVNVRGFGIGKMDWRIYNRWGQLVFQSSSKKIGWNGYYKGKLQPMDVYGYTLDVEFTDGNKLRKTGDITLLK